MTAAAPLIRAAGASDASVINAIHNHYVLTSTTTFQIEPWSEDRRQAWLRDRRPEHPVFVVEAEGQVVGWAALGPFHSRAAYARTAEPSVYLRHDWLGRGLGRRMLWRLIENAEASGLRSLVSLIAADQPASLVLHEKLGFERAGCIRDAGFKFERWIDVVYMQRMI